MQPKEAKKKDSQPYNPLDEIDKIKSVFEECDEKIIKLKEKEKKESVYAIVFACMLVVLYVSIQIYAEFKK